MQIGWCLISLWFSVLTLFVVCAHKLPLIHTQDSFNSYMYIHTSLLKYTQVFVHTHKFPYIHTCSCSVFLPLYCMQLFLSPAFFIFAYFMCTGYYLLFFYCGHCGCIPAPPNIHRRTAEKQGVGVVKWRAEMLQGREIRSLWVGIQFEYTFGK